MTDTDPNEPARVATHVHRDFDVLIVRIGEDPAAADLRRTLDECIAQVDAGAMRIVIAGKGMRAPNDAIDDFVATLTAEVEPRGVTVSLPAPGGP
jgi:hypothetical protein